MACSGTDLAFIVPHTDVSEAFTASIIRAMSKPRAKNRAKMQDKIEVHRPDDGRQEAPSKRPSIYTRLHGATSQKKAIFILAAMRT
jgi:hypothetical protein